jgi:uncharacterized protein
MADWDNIKETGNVEDRRTMPVAGGLGLVGVVAIIALTLFSGGNDPQVNEVIDQLSNQQSTTQQVTLDPNDTYASFASKVLGSGNKIWKPLVESTGSTYREPKLVLFRQETASGCGGASSEVGPHYCPADDTIYLDETFFEELTARFGAKGGDVAEAYVIAHELGHHVQNTLGTSNKVEKLSRVNPDEANVLSVETELQADCYAGVWAKSVNDRGNVFTIGEITEAIDAASSVGDDRIQKEATGTINPETWTHGSSADRVKWFNVGYAGGGLKGCETF